MRRPAPHLALLAAVLAVAACEFAPATLEPAPARGSATASAAQAPAISMDDSWRMVDGVWTFSGWVDPMGSPTTVIMEIGYDSANWRSFVNEVAVADGVTAARSVRGSVEITDETWLCARFRAENAAGDGVSPPLCLPTRLDSMRSVDVTPAPS